MKYRGTYERIDSDVLRTRFYHHYLDYPFLLILDSNSNQYDQHSEFRLLLAVGRNKVEFNTHNRWEQLKQEYDAGQWLLGYIGYDLKNETENMQSLNTDYTGFPEITFFKPDILVIENNAGLHIYSDTQEPDSIYQLLHSDIVNSDQAHFKISSVEIRQRTPKEKYLHQVGSIIEDIRDGNYYEINYCQEFYVEGLTADPFVLFEKMNQKTKMPFASFLKLDRKYILCCSPERYLKKKGRQWLSQPIKGTSARSTSEDVDHKNKLKLEHSEKERAENLMIVDLVRNDLRRSSKTGTVKVDELCKVYSFIPVHQMISTISAELQDEVHPITALKRTFPMGSMTGAPKIETMKRIDQLEDTKRNVYSGCMGYINPDGDFDFNVVIRTLIYNTETAYASYHAGSAITYDSDPQSEYEECLLKAQTFFSLVMKD